jgi:hypothetical protein
MDGKLAAFQQGLDSRYVLNLPARQLFIGQDGITVAFQLAFQNFSGLRPVITTFSQVDSGLGCV